MTRVVGSFQQFRLLSTSTASANLVGEWSTARGMVKLFYKSGQEGLFRFGFSTGSAKESTFTSPYTMEEAAALVDKFRAAIATNLEKEEPDASCFLPKAYTRTPEVEIALFGRVDLSPDPTQNKAKILSWGIFSSKEKSGYALEPQNNDCAEDFLCNHLVQRDGIERFRAFVDIDDRTQRVSAIALRPVSLFDSTVDLSADVWAVTLVSKKEDSRLATLVSAEEASRSAGHAMIAIEGVQSGKAFARCLHITTRETPRSGATIKTGNLTQEQAKKLHHSPTWPRTPEQVAAMEANPSTRVEFAYLPHLEAMGVGGIGLPLSIGCARDCYTLLGGRNAASDMLDPGVHLRAELLVSLCGGPRIESNYALAQRTDELFTRRALGLSGVAIIAALLLFISRCRATRQNCVKWCISTLKKGGIHINLGIRAIPLLPNQVITYLIENPNKVTCTGE